MMSFRPCKKVHTFLLLKCSKIKYLILIPTVCILLSFVLSFNVFAYSTETVWANWSTFSSKWVIDWGSFYYDQTSSSVLPKDNSLPTYDFSSFNTDYIQCYNGGYTKSNAMAQFAYSVAFDNIDNYNSFSTYAIAIGTNTNNYNGSISVKFYNGNSLAHTETLSFRYLPASGRVQNDYVDVIYNSSTVILDNSSISIRMYTINQFLISGDCTRIVMDVSHVFTSGFYANIVIPTYKIGYQKLIYDEWEKQQMEMHEQTISEISKIGDDISQGFADLNSAEQSRHNEIMGSEYSLPADTVSEFEEMEEGFSELGELLDSQDLDISQGLADLQSFDESQFIDDIDTALSDMDNADFDITYQSFVNLMYQRLGIGSYLLLLVPFMVIFIVVKFVVGGVV